MENLTERMAIPLMQKWLQFKNEQEKINVPKSTKQSNMWKVNALIKHLETDDLLGDETIKKIFSLPNEYAYKHRLARMLQWGIRWAYRKKHIQSNPLEDCIKFPEPTFDHNKVSLTKEQMSIIASVPFEGKLDEARRLFILQKQTGLAYCDLKALPFRGKVTDSHYVDENGVIIPTRWIVTKRQKTGKAAYIKLTPELEKEIEWLGSIKVPHLTVYNQRLKEVQAVCGFTIKSERGAKLRSHMARKTFAQQAGEMGVDHTAIRMYMGINDKALYKSYLDENLSVLEALSRRAS